MGTEAKKLKEELFTKKESGWLSISEEEKIKIFDFSKDYINFMNKSKTERETLKNIKSILDKNGFKDLNTLNNINSGDKVYYINRNKSIFISIIGKEPLENGLNLIGGHLDSPRLDLKPNPLYEENGFAYLKTHYYGGIKKYQWTAIPLAIHGAIVKTNGEVINIELGEKEDDPIFTITDLLPHLAVDQMNKKMSEAIDGEDLNILIGSIPYDKKASDSLKLNILNILNQKYDIKESDFNSSEIEIAKYMFSIGENCEVISFTK